MPKSVHRSIAGLLVVATLLAGSVAWAGVAAVTLDSYLHGNAGNFVVGFEFDVLSPITVTALGKFDLDGNGQIDDTTSPQAAIWNDDTNTQLALATIPNGAGGTLDNGVFYTPITPLPLNPGNYVVGVQTFAGQERFAYDATITTAPSISWVQGRFKGGTAIGPLTGVRPQPTSYFGANFQFVERLTPVSYAYDGTGQGATPSNFPDTGTAELTDGLLPDSTAFTDPRWVGFRDDPPDDGTAQPQVTFTFDAWYALDELTVWYLQSTDASGTITAPEEVLLSTSNDGTTFSTPISLTAFDSTIGTEIRTATFDLTGLDLVGHYARLDFRNTSQWTFLGEVAFSGTFVPEPTTLTLLALGALPLLRRRRRNP